VRNDQLHREESFAAACRLKRTESRGRKRTENPNSGCGPGEEDGPGGRGEDGGQENADPNWSGVKKRQQLGGIVQQRSQQLLGRSGADGSISQLQQPTPQPRISGNYPFLSK